MEINLSDTVMEADTPAECTIVEAEATADRLRQLSKNLTRIVVRAEKNSGDRYRVFSDTGGVEDICESAAHSLCDGVVSGSQ